LSLRFKSLVESVLVWREPQWRARELELEKAGQLPSQRYRKGNSRKGPRAHSLAVELQGKVSALRDQGLSYEQISDALGIARSTVNRALDKAAVAAGTRAKNFTHGTTTGYAQGCRCDPCKTAKSKAQHAYEQRKKERAAKPVEVPVQLTLEVLEVRRAANDSAAVRGVLG
jgi:IS30 family transposase